MIKRRLNIVMVMALVAMIATACNNQAKYPGFEQNKETGLFYKIFSTNSDTSIAHVGDMMSVFMRKNIYF